MEKPRIRVLIETLWNVKLFSWLSTLWTSSVLIETLWNVKLIDYQDIAEATRINRNIVECKGLPEEDLMYLGSCINRNIVECKVDRLKLASDISLSINRNIVECKDAIINRYDTKIAVLIETLWNVKQWYAFLEDFDRSY